MITAGIDAGSRAVKVVLWDAAAQAVVATGQRDQGVRQAAIAEALLADLLGEAGLSPADVARCVATGYGREAVTVADEAVTEITCHARGVRQVAPAARTIVEIGGQDSKLIKLDAGGAVRDFAMNDRCAAGTGRFLEMVADRLEVGLERLGDLAAASTAPAAISSMCVVFAETEIVGLLAGGAAPADVVAGVQKAIAARVAAMGGRRLDTPVVFTGGVARVGGVTQALADGLGVPVAVAPQPQFTGALGAALVAAARAEASLQQRSAE